MPWRTGETPLGRRLQSRKTPRRARQSSRGAQHAFIPINDTRPEPTAVRREHVSSASSRHRVEYLPGQFGLQHARRRRAPAHDGPLAAVVLGDRRAVGDRQHGGVGEALGEDRRRRASPSPRRAPRWRRPGSASRAACSERAREAPGAAARRRRAAAPRARCRRGAVASGSRSSRRSTSRMRVVGEGCRRRRDRRPPRAGCRSAGRAVRRGTAAARRPAASMRPLPNGQMPAMARNRVVLTTPGRPEQGDALAARRTVPLRSLREHAPSGCVEADDRSRRSAGCRRRARRGCAGAPVERRRAVVVERLARTSARRSMLARQRGDLLVGVDEPGQRARHLAVGDAGLRSRCRASCGRRRTPAPRPAAARCRWPGRCRW